MNKQEIEKAISLLKSDIGVLDNYLKKHPHLKEDRCVENQLIKDMEFTISALKYQLTNGWIPVSERLPNIGETVLLTVAVNRGISHEYGSVDIAWICDKENKCFYGTDGKYSHDEAIAWQPLPPKYKEVSHE